MKFGEVIGQDQVKKHLINTVRNSRVSHAQLFLGPPASGKLSMAIAYAQYINCRNRTETDSCGECPSCVKFGKMAHPDLHFIYPTAKTRDIEKPTSKDFIRDWRELLLNKNAYIQLPDWYEKIGIEKKQAIINARDCSDIISTLNYKSYEAEYKVMIIWMVEKLFHAAAPKILKVLEEPPEKTLFILVAESQENIINTILSRTQLVKFNPIESEALQENLESLGYDPVNVRDAIRVAGGNYALALNLASQPEAEGQNFTWFTNWMRVCYRGKFAEMLEFVNEISGVNRDAQKGMLRFGLRIIRESLLEGFEQSKLSRLNNRESEFTARFHKFIHTGNIALINEELNQSIAHIDRNANPNVLFFDASIKLAQYLKKK
ncbi:MAG: DNA polymerase III subunit delta [Bacteroidales bacterium]|nr:DNA polymerase III subunit delta [Bacteroidales bacterium]